MPGDGPVRAEGAHSRQGVGGSGQARRRGETQPGFAGRRPSRRRRRCRHHRGRQDPGEAPGAGGQVWQEGEKGRRQKGGVEPRAQRGSRRGRGSRHRPGARSTRPTPFQHGQRRGVGEARRGDARGCRGWEPQAARGCREAGEGGAGHPVRVGVV